MINTLMSTLLMMMMMMMIIYFLVYYLRLKIVYIVLSVMCAKRMDKTEEKLIYAWKKLLEYAKVMTC